MTEFMAGDRVRIVDRWQDDRIQFGTVLGFEPDAPDDLLVRVDGATVHRWIPAHQLSVVASK